MMSQYLNTIPHLHMKFKNTLVTLCTLLAVVLLIPSVTDAQTAATQNTLIVFDASGSMQELFDETSRLAAAKGAVFEFLNGQQSAVGLRMYAHVNQAGNEAAACIETALVQNFSTEYQSIKDYVQSVQAVGSYTPTAYALEAAAGDFVPDRQNTLILLTDGKETCGGDPAAAAAALQAAGIDVVTHVIGLGVDAETRAELASIAAAGGGEYYDASDTQTLADSFSAIEAATVDKTKVQRDTQAIRGGNEVASAAAITPGEYTLDHHQRPKEYDYFYIEMTPGDTYYISIGYTGKDIDWDSSTDTFSLPSYDDGPEGDSLRGKGWIYFLSHDGRTEKILNTIRSESGAGKQKEDYATVVYQGGDSVRIQTAADFEGNSDGRVYKAHPLVGSFDRFYFKVGPQATGNEVEMHKDVPFTITRLEEGFGTTDSANNTTNDQIIAGNNDLGQSGGNVAGDANQFEANQVNPVLDNQVTNTLGSVTSDTAAGSWYAMNDTRMWVIIGIALFCLIGFIVLLVLLTRKSANQSTAQPVVDASGVMQPLATAQIQNPAQVQSSPPPVAPAQHSVPGQSQVGQSPPPPSNTN